MERRRECEWGTCENEVRGDLGLLCPLHWNYVPPFLIEQYKWIRKMVFMAIRAKEEIR